MFLMFLSREIDIKLCPNYTNIYIYIYIQFCIKVIGLNRSYSANTQPMAVQCTGHVIQTEIT